MFQFTPASCDAGDDRDLLLLRGEMLFQFTPASCDAGD